MRGGFTVENMHFAFTFGDQIGLVLIATKVPVCHKLRISKSIFQAIRVLGLLGALDPYKHKVFLGQIDSQTDAGAVLSQSDPKQEMDSQGSYERLSFNTCIVLMDSMLLADNSCHFVAAQLSTTYALLKICYTIHTLLLHVPKSRLH